MKHTPGPEHASYSELITNLQESMPADFEAVDHAFQHDQQAPYKSLNAFLRHGTGATAPKKLANLLEDRFGIDRHSSNPRSSDRHSLAKAHTEYLPALCRIMMRLCDDPSEAMEITSMISRVFAPAIYDWQSNLPNPPQRLAPLDNDHFNNFIETAIRTILDSKGEGSALQEFANALYALLGTDEATRIPHNIRINLATNSLGANFWNRLPADLTTIAASRAAIADIKDQLREFALAILGNPPTPDPDKIRQQQLRTSKMAKDPRPFVEQLIATANQFKQYCQLPTGTDAPPTQKGQIVEQWVTTTGSTELITRVMFESRRVHELYHPAGGLTTTRLCHIPSTSNNFWLQGAEELAADSHDTRALNLYTHTPATWTMQGRYHHLRSFLAHTRHTSLLTREACMVPIPQHDLSVENTFPFGVLPNLQRLVKLGIEFNDPEITQAVYAVLNRPEFPINGARELATEMENTLEPELWQAPQYYNS